MCVFIEYFKQNNKTSIFNNKNKGKNLEERFGVATANKIKNGVRLSNSIRISGMKGKTLEEYYGEKISELIDEEKKHIIYLAELKKRYE